MIQAKWGFPDKIVNDPSTKIRPNKVHIVSSLLQHSDQTTLSYEQLLRRPEITIEFIENFIEIPFNKEIKEQVYINLKYEGYIQKAYKEAEKMLKLEEKQIPKDIDYDKVNNIASEAKQKLKDVRPLTLAQASRISGVNPVDISVLSIYLK